MDRIIPKNQIFAAYNDNSSKMGHPAKSQDSMQKRFLSTSEGN
jgi:hypothetical protein